MVSHILIESLSAADAARAAGIHGEIAWHSSSPAVIEGLRRKGERVAWLEDNVAADLTDRLSPHALSIVEQLLHRLEPAFATLDMSSLSPLLGRQLHAAVGTLLYKQALLSGLVEATGRPVLVGVPRIEAAPYGNVSYHRYDTLFSVLGSHSVNGLKVIDHKAERPEREDVVDRPSALGRFLSLSDLSFSQLLWRFWQFGMGRRRLALGPSKARVHVMRGNEVIREMLPHLLFRGASVEQLALSVQSVAAGAPLAELPDEAGVRACFPSRGELGFPFEAVAHCVSHLLHEASRWWRPLCEKARVEAKGHANTDRPGIVLTNTPPGFYASAAIAALEENGVSTVVAEHGVSAGLSAYHLAIRQWNEARFGNAYLVCNPNTRAFLEQDKHMGNVAIRSVGLADLVRSVRLRRIQRFLVRRSLGVGTERVVLYLLRPEQNNLRNIPYSSHDRDTYDMQKAIAMDVLPNVRGRGVLKTYPTQRFIDPLPFGNALAYPNNVKVIDKGDFRFVRAASDVIILPSLMSTVGFAFGAGVPIVFLRQRGIDPLPDVEAGLNDAVFVVDVREDGWKEGLLALLNSPGLEAEWERKRAAREAFVKRYISGPADAGRNGAIELLALLKPSPGARAPHPAQST